MLLRNYEQKYTPFLTFNKNNTRKCEHTKVVYQKPYVDEETTQLPTEEGQHDKQ